MKSLLRLFSPVPLVTLSASGMVVMAGWAGLRYGLPKLAIVGFVLFIVVIWALVLWILKLRAAKAGSALEKSLEQQGQRQLATARPGREKDIEQIRTQLLEAIQALKASRVGKGKKGSGALYVLPWYMIIGPPAAGKTTLLQNSGLNFPYLDPNRSRSSVRGVGGTRNCDWWFSDEAVILDTAGRYVLPVEADDTQEWLGFLDLLRKFRGRKPINGLIVGVSVQDLIGGTDEEMENHAHRIRSRIDELIKQLGITFPVYVVFTKCDLVRGFIEFFGDLSKAERAQAWGATIAADRVARDPAHRIFEEEMDRLTDALAHAKVLRLAQIVSPEVRPQVLFFPLQFAAMKARLSHFLEILLRVNPYQDSPIFRGFYFTSGTQEGRPIDQVINAMLKGFGVDAGGEGMYVEPTQTKSYFIEDVFSKVAFPDRYMAGPSAAGERRSRALRVRSFVAGTAVLAGFLLVLASLYSVNRSLVSQASSLSSKAVHYHVQENQMLALEDLNILDRLRLCLERMDRRHRFVVKAAMLSTYQGEAAAAAARRVHLTVLHDGVMKPAIPLLEERLKQVGSGAEPGFQRYYAMVRTWQMLKDPARLLATPYDAEEAAGVLADLCAGTLGSGNTEEYRSLLSMQLAYAGRFRNDFGRLFRPESRPAAAIDGIVNPRLRDQWSSRGLFPGLQAGASAVPAVTVSSLVPDDRYLAGTAQVDGAFTRAGWKGPVRAYVEWVDRTRTDWALANAFGNEPPSPRDGLLSQYADSYVDQWLRFLDGVGAKVGGGDADPRAFLERACTEESPIVRILRGVSDNAEVGRNEGAPELAAVGESLGVVEEFLRPAQKGGLIPNFRFLRGIGGGGKAPYQIYLEKVAALKDGYAQIVSSPHPEMEKPVSDLDGWITDRMPQTRAGRVLGRFLSLPSETVAKKVRSEQGQAVAQEWGRVVSDFRERFAGRYPFDPGASREAALDDFKDFFGPDGILWGFYDRQLRDRVSEDGEALAQDVSLNPEFQTFLRKANRIKHAFFTPGGETHFSVTFVTKSPANRPAGVSWYSSTLLIGGVSYVQTSGQPAPRRLDWPGPNPDAGASLELDLRNTAQARSFSSQGVWGFFRLLRQAQKVSSSGDKVKIAWQVPTDMGAVEVEFTASGLSVNHPLDPGLLTLRCPDRIGTAP